MNPLANDIQYITHNLKVTLLVPHKKKLPLHWATWDLANLVNISPCVHSIFLFSPIFEFSSLYGFSWVPLRIHINLTQIRWIYLSTTFAWSLANIWWCQAHGINGIVWYVPCQITECGAWKQGTYRLLACTCKVLLPKLKYPRPSLFLTFCIDLYDFSDTMPKVIFFTLTNLSCLGQLEFCRYLVQQSADDSNDNQMHFCL